MNINEITKQEISEFLRRKRGIVLNKDDKFPDPDILMILPGNRIIRRSDVVAQMNGHPLGICRCSSRCKDYNPPSIICSYNNYSMMNGNGLPECYVPIRVNGRFIK